MREPTVEQLERWTEIGRRYAAGETTLQIIRTMRTSTATIDRALAYCFTPEERDTIKRRHFSRASHRTQERIRAKTADRNARIVDRWLTTDLNVHQIGAEFHLTGSAVTQIVLKAGYTAGDRHFSRRSHLAPPPRSPR